MGRLAPTTINCYKWKLKRYRKLLQIVLPEDPRRPQLLEQITKLTNQLGMEMSDLEIKLARGPGRPRSVPDMSDIEEALKDNEKEVEATETPEERALRIKAKHQALRDKLKESDPEFIASQDAMVKSNEMLMLMMKEELDATNKPTTNEPEKA